MPGDRVFVRMDPADAGQVYLFTEDGLTFLGEAVSPELSGHDPQELIARVKAAQKRVDLQGLLRRVASDLLDEIGAGDTDAKGVAARELIVSDRR